MAQDEAIKLGVVAKQTVCLPVNCSERSSHLLRPIYPGFLATNFDADHLSLEPRIADVLRCAELAQRVLNVVVRLKIDNDESIPIDIGRFDFRYGDRRTRLSADWFLLLLDRGVPAHSEFL